MSDQPIKKILERKDVEQLHPKLTLLPVIPQTLAEKTQTIAFDQQDKTLFLLTTNNNPELHHQILDKLEAKGYEFDIYYTDSDAFTYALSWYQQLHDKQSSEQDKFDYLHSVSGNEAVALIKDAYAHLERYSEGEFINEILRLSYQAGASDVHFQTEELGVVMRIRKDGVLQTVIVFEHVEFQKYLMKIKYISGVKMNIAKNSQDGRFDFDIVNNGQKIQIDVRVSIMPSLRGESIVMRFLDATKGIMSLEKLGIGEAQVKLIHAHMKRNYGMILITWPTGSGKTTTVYSMLNRLNTTDKKIITLENPVEYELPGIEQTQINEKKWFTFEEGLKGILRHDPDIIMVGEIRSLETADMAINAALTWHLVISTLHTNSAVEAISRLLNMWVQPYMLAPALNLIIGQRLVRKLNKSEEKEAPKDVDAQIQAVLEDMATYHHTPSVPYDGKIFYPVVDKDVFGSGYEGRLAVVETFDVNDKIKSAILEWVSTLDILEMAKQDGFISMQQDGFMKLLEGKTSIEEVRRVL